MEECMKKIILCVLLLCLAFTLIAQDQTESENGIKSSDSLTLLISSLPEAMLTYTKSYNIPFLQGDNPLTAGNNVNAALSVDLTPISLEGSAEAVLTPIAFFQVSAGGKFGTGWNAELFGSQLYGIGLNEDDGTGHEEQDGSGFDGVMWKAQVGAALQMDMAAIFPGDWNHIVFRTYHEINHRGYSRAKGHDSWYYQNDAGENQNGFNYYGNYMLGYQMPIFLNTVGLMAESDLYLYDTPKASRWGDDKLRWHFAAAFYFTITEKLGASLIAQFRTRRTYEEGKESKLNKEEDDQIYYRNRNLETSDLSLEFYRVAVGLTYTF
jgi:hypothetical protein